MGPAVEVLHPWSQPRCLCSRLVGIGSSFDLRSEHYDRVIGSSQQGLHSNRDSIDNMSTKIRTTDEAVSSCNCLIFLMRDDACAATWPLQTWRRLEIRGRDNRRYRA